MARRGAVVVYTAAALAYLVAVVHRTALGVAGVDAIERFGLSATGLAAFSVVQLAVYAALQIPAGQLLDRFGARALVAGGSLVMAVGQALLAWADDVPTAIVARVLIGAGDAGIFISACRLVAEWFPPRRVPVLVQLTGLIGQSGQLVSAVAVAWLLHARGWGVTFGVLAALGMLVAVVAWVGVRAPVPATPADAIASAARARFLHAVRDAARPAGTRLGFWSHFLAPFSANVVALLWGVPFFVTAQGRSPGEASALLSVLTVSAMVSGPLVGRWTARHPLRRSWSVLASATATLAAWVWLLVPDTPRPFAQLAVFCVVVGAGGPVSLVGLDFARTSTAADRLGTATGFVNTGGFASTMVGILAVGVVLQVASPPGATTYSLDAYRLAFAVLLVPWLVGVTGVLRNRRLARADMARAGTVVPSVREVLRRRRP
ncbi:MFS transporter [Cellulomonas shaoxiangyii]|uniref:MFS transporter n=1 Tax=Cellulomonas shaoxiangyii TaxID=2566013 RepID=A0A4P7SLR9_9CELL|nr:MFS transporter [Cellulomonas shaoxiangyii]QCB94477.1 MFS transporter [Cellulomonas shaoxiangyii]TGY86059.1 MFS transporter [Cellulomonas shaoxiangyii]